MADDLVVRVNVVGHASKRWRGARDQADAQQRNQRLSDARALTVRQVVEGVLRAELPGVSLDVPARGVGSTQPFPTASETNAAVDRSVVVTIDLTTVGVGSTSVRRPVRIHTPSKFWTLRVLALRGGVVAGVKTSFMRIAIRNSVSGYELKMNGYLFGGSLSPLSKKPVDLGGKGNPADLMKPVGRAVTFVTDEAEDFGYFVGADNGQTVRVVHSTVGAVRKVATTFLQFTELDTYSPGSLVFEYKTGWSLPALNVAVEAGKLSVEGDVPPDYVEDTTLVDVPTVHEHNIYDGVLVSFPTEKAGLEDLTARDREQLREFAAMKARTIRALASSGYRVTNPRP